jgi:hypothetical protein
MLCLWMFSRLIFELKAYHDSQSILVRVCFASAQLIVTSDLIGLK